MKASRKHLTVDAPVARALRRFATGAFRGGMVHANGDETFEIDDEVATTIERFRQPGDDDPTLLRRVLKHYASIDIPPTKPN